jgi:hypothetical protein
MSTPPFGSIRAAALELYDAPFKFSRGYIYDANNERVSDDGGPPDREVATHIISRVRGWGRIGYKPNPELLQDEVGACIAEALTDFWNKHKGAK